MRPITQVPVGVLFDVSRLALVSLALTYVCKLHDGRGRFASAATTLEHLRTEVPYLREGLLRGSGSRPQVSLGVLQRPIVVTLRSILSLGRIQPPLQPLGVRLAPRRLKLPSLRKRERRE